MSGQVYLAHHAMKKSRLYLPILLLTIALPTANTILAQTAPVALCQDVTVDAGANCAAAASIDNGSYDPDGDTVTVTQTPPGPYPLGVTVVTLRITDDGDLYDECQATVTVVDNTPPYYTFCPGDLTVGWGESTDPANTGTALGEDACHSDPTVWYTDDVVSGPCPPDIIINRTWHLSDGASGSDITCLQVITAADLSPPQITCPDPVTVECLADVSPPDIDLVTAIDNRDPAPLIEHVGDIQQWECPLEITRTYRATDACGNSVTCVQLITVEDTTEPDITAGLGPIEVECVSEIPEPEPELITGSDNCDPDPLIEHIGDISDGKTCPEIITRYYQVSDNCDNAAIFEQTITVQDQTPPLFNSPGDQTAFLCEPEPVCVTIDIFDNCDPNPSLTVISGPGTISGDQWCYTPQATTVADVTLRGTDNCGNYRDVVFHVDMTVNSRPQITNCPEEQIYIPWGETFVYYIEVEDPDGDQTVTLSLCDGAPAGATLDPVTGRLELTVCAPTLCVVATDECGATDDCSLEVCMENAPPIINCPGDLTFCYGTPLETQVTAFDPDIGPSAFFHLVSGPVGLEVDTSSGDISWPEPTPGTWDVCVEATERTPRCDPCNPSIPDTCCFSIEVVTADVVIEKVNNQAQGQIADVSIDFLHPTGNWPVAGFDMLIQYDPRALSFMNAVEGRFMSDCEWEYFTYRFGADGNCGGGTCPPGVLRVAAIAEIDTGNPADHPDCYTNDGVADPGPASTTSTQLVEINFLVSNDLAIECQFVPVRFLWYDCDDNELLSLTGDTLFRSNRVFDYAGELGSPPVVQWNEITGTDLFFPTVTGAPTPPCDVNPDYEVVACANFHNGGIDIVCGHGIEPVGDVNLNDIAFEIADVVMLTNYFLLGLDAFGSHVDGSVAASDANRDGVTLSVADLVYMIRVVIGDVHPQKNTVLTEVRRTGYSVENGIISVADDLDIGGAALVVRGEVVPELTVDGMDIGYAFDGVNTHILVTPSLQAPRVNSFRGSFLAGITGKLLSIELATPEGIPVVAKNIPENYRLGQNYPNPFNPATTIEYSLPRQNQVTIEIFNALGQKVRTLVDQIRPAGTYQTVWNGTDSDGRPVSTGVYYYRFQAGDYVETRKMLLLK